jgi:hypothetical protein
MPASSSWARTQLPRRLRRKAALGDPQIGSIKLRSGMLVIGESLHRQRYKFLWDLLFERHPHGTYIKGKWEGMGSAKTDIPSDRLILELLRHTPTMLLLDEFQNWYDGLSRRNLARAPGSGGRGASEPVSRRSLAALSPGKRRSRRRLQSPQHRSANDSCRRKERAEARPRAGARSLPGGARPTAAQ